MVHGIVCLFDPVNFFDSLGLSAADVAAMNKTFRSTVDKMTSEGTRHPNKDINNISRFIHDYISESLGNPYLGCWEQADIVVDALRDIDKDDDWKITREGRYFPPHYWVEAISDNPEDPKIIFDPQDDLIQNFFPHDKSYYDNNNSYTPCD